MSQESVEIVRRATDALNRLDVDAFVERTTPEFEWFPVLGGTVERTSFKGRDGIAEQFTELRDTWEEFRVVVEETRDLGDRVLSLGTLEARGRSSGVEVESPIGWIADFRDGRIWRVRAFPDHAAALEAAGHAE